MAQQLLNICYTYTFLPSDIANMLIVNIVDTHIYHNDTKCIWNAFKLKFLNF